MAPGSVLWITDIKTMAIQISQIELFHSIHLCLSCWCGSSRKCYFLDLLTNPKLTFVYKLVFIFTPVFFLPSFSPMWNVLPTLLVMLLEHAFYKRFFSDSQYLYKVLIIVGVDVVVYECSLCSNKPESLNR